MGARTSIMGNSHGKFSDQDSYLQTAQTQLAANNSVELNVALTEANQLRATNLNITNQSINRVPESPFPSTSTVGQNTTSAALAGVDQPPVPPVDRPVHGCFVYDTLVWMDDDSDKPIGKIQLGDYVKAFDKLGNIISAKVIGCYAHLVDDLLIVTFDDGSEVITTPQHRYWIGDEHFEPIFNLDEVWHWDGKWVKRKIADKQILSQETAVYNIEVEIFKTYVANGDAVHNLKPIPGE